MYKKYINIIIHFSTLRYSDVSMWRQRYCQALGNTAQNG